MSSKSFNIGLFTAYLQLLEWMFCVLFQRFTNGIMEMWKNDRKQDCYDGWIDRAHENDFRNGLFSLP